MCLFYEPYHRLFHTIKKKTFRIILAVMAM